MTLAQVGAVARARSATPACVSVFAGRIADTGSIRFADDRGGEAAGIAPKAELIWASPRELLSVFKRMRSAAIITVTSDILKKLTGRPRLGPLDTVKMFFSDAAQAGFAI